MAAEPQDHTLGRELRDGYEVHRAALARGLNVKLLPRQVMEVSGPNDPTKTVSFTHGMPQSTTLAGATYAQDLRVRRAMLEKAGFSVPRGATFSVGRSQSLARRFAKRIGYPVVLKPAVGDNTIEVARNLRNEDELNRAIQYLYTPPSQREKFTRAAYGLTELREPGRVNGKIVAPPGYRFLIEKHVHGQYIRFLIIGRKVENVLYCPTGPWESVPGQVQDVTKSTHQSLKDIAERAATTVPGLSVVALDLVVPDHQAKTVVNDAEVVELSERPWLAVQHGYDSDLAAKIAGNILKENFPQTDGHHVEGRITARVVIGGTLEPLALLKVMKAELSFLGIDSCLHQADKSLGQIRGTITGLPKDIAWIMERLLDNGIEGQRAMLTRLDKIAISPE